MNRNDGNTVHTLRRLLRNIRALLAEHGEVIPRAVARVLEDGSGETTSRPDAATGAGTRAGAGEETGESYSQGWDAVDKRAEIVRSAVVVQAAQVRPTPGHSLTPVVCRAITKALRCHGCPSARTTWSHSTASSSSSCKPSGQPSR